MRRDAVPTGWEAIGAYDGESIFATPSLALTRGAPLMTACARPDQTHHVVLKGFLFLHRPIRPASLSRCGAIRAQTKVRWWRDREQQQPRRSAWSSIRPVASLPQHHQARTLAWSGWSASSHDKPLGISFKKKPIAGGGSDLRSRGGR